ncbi:transcriptional regulator, GntR family [Desulfomicrobium apsheronum]|uniref:Transcriptional regulator, GntR family n=1 Tax=Desulfomicrobium apsheronum TaxID=52560 RepID=A0A1I3MWF6_9BACT|nr:GntR family transcriptional regulator [Desulfomicrobium apsheronum]SFJ01085.1 transcriptional regulator, GntR family [Desulfomicrobium apsheronum]
MEDHGRLLNQLELVVLEKGLQPGDKLPPERELAGQMLVSRNTLRGLLRTLEAQGLVTIKPGSGTFLRSRLAGIAHLHRSSRQAAADQIKAAFLFLPPILGKALQTISVPRINDLQAGNIALSQAMCDGDPLRVWSEIALFFRLIAQETENYFLVKTVEQMFSVDPSFVDHFFQTDRDILEDIFAGHVSILQALRERNAGRISSLTGQYLLSICRALEAGNKFSVWESVSHRSHGEDAHE